MQFHRNFYREILDPDVPVRFPIVSTTLLSESILVETWEPGSTIADMFRVIKDVSADKQAHLAKLIFDITAKMFLRDNFIHGDLHAGNLLYNQATQEVAVMDAGLVTTLPGDVFNEFGDFIRALCTKDTAEMTDKLILFHDDTVKNALPKEMVNRERLHADLEDIFTNGAGRTRPGVPLAQALGDIIGDMLRRIGNHGVLLRGDVASCIMTISVAEGLVMSLDPTMDILQLALPYFVRYRGWESTEAIVDSGYETSERKAKDMAEELKKPVSDVIEGVHRNINEVITQAPEMVDKVIKPLKEAVDKVPAVVEELKKNVGGSAADPSAAAAAAPAAPTEPAIASDPPAEGSSS